MGTLKVHFSGEIKELNFDMGQAQHSFSRVQSWGKNLFEELC